jgi:hypothetical protein
MNYPNKTFVLEIFKEHFNADYKYMIIIVADNKETAANYINDMLGFNIISNHLTWLMNCDHPTIYDRSGNKPLEIQAKIMYNTSIKLLK